MQTSYENINSFVNPYIKLILSAILEYTEFKFQLFLTILWT